MKIKLQLIFSFCSLILWQCAAIAPPGGGEKDTTPPELLSVHPPSGTVRLLKQTVELHFSEYMDEKSFTKTIRFSPVLKGDPQIHFKGERVSIDFPEGIKNDMTVILTLGREIKDEHGIGLAQAIQLAYSTGDQIDDSIIKGRVYSNTESSVYLFKETGGDSLLLKEPNYISETADDGSFQFNYLAPGSYTILALERGATGSVLDTKRMQYGVSFFEHITLDSVFTHVNMRLFREEQPLQISNGTWKDWNWGEVKFNQKLAPDLQIKNISVVDQNAHWFFHPTDSTSLILVVNDSLPVKRAHIRFNDVQLHGRLILDSTAVSVSVPTEADTNFLMIIEPKNSLTITPEKEGPEAQLIFSRPIMADHFDHYRLELFIADTIPVKISRTNESPMSINFMPVNGWESQAKYLLKIFNDPDQDYKQTFKDSITIVIINTKKEQGYGGLLGQVVDSGKKKMMAELQHTQNKHWIFNSFVNSNSRFEYVDIPEGFYTLLIYEDRDNNGSYSFGSANPFFPSEWFYVSPDTFEVRANWDVEIPKIIVGE